MSDLPPQRFPLLVSPENRDETTTKDAKLINGFIEPKGDDLWLYKRPGLVVNTSLVAGAGLGAYSWNGDVYVIVGSTLYRNGVSVYNSMDTSNGVYTFSVSLGATPGMLIQNGVVAYSYTVAGGVVVIPQTSTVTTTCTLTSGSAVVTMASTTGLRVNASVSGSYIPASTTILSINSSTQITLSAAVSSRPSIQYAGVQVSGTSPVTINSVSPSTANLVVGYPINITDSLGNPAAFPGSNPTVASITPPSTMTYSFGGGAIAAGVAQYFTSAQAPSFSESVTFVNTGTQPAGFVKGSAYLDGTSYLLTPTSYVQGSAFNDVTNWQPLNSIMAMIDPSPGIFMTSQLSYVVAMKQYSVESFYDNGNAVGSPLAFAPNVKVNVGCKHAGSVQRMAGDLLWIGETREGSIQVMHMENMQANVISTPAVDKLLQDGDYTTVYSWHARTGGHRFYGVTLKNSNLTLVYDLTTKLWAQWTDANGNYFPVVASTINNSQQSLLLHETNGKLYYLDFGTYTDDGAIFPVDIYTPNWDGGVRKKKVISILDICGDQVIGSILQVRNSDDDYQTWTNFRVVDLSVARPYLTNNGTFRRRAYHLRHFSNTPMRLRALEMQVDIGEL